MNSDVQWFWPRRFRNRTHDFAHAMLTKLPRLLRAVFGLVRRFPYRVVHRSRLERLGSEAERYDLVEKGRYDYVPKGLYVFGPRSEYLLVRKNRYRVVLRTGEEKLTGCGVGWLTEDNTAESYDQLWGNDEALTQFRTEADAVRERLTEEIVDHIVGLISDGAKVVDIGCGVGDLLVALRRRLPGIRVAGLDFSGKAIEGARRNLPDGDFVLHEMSTLPYGEGEFDAVLCTDTLEHMERPRQVVEELARICAPRGHVVIVVPDGDVDDFLGHLWFWNEPALAEFLSPWRANVQRLPETRELLAVIRVGAQS